MKSQKALVGEVPKRTASIHIYFSTVVNFPVFIEGRYYVVLAYIRTIHLRQERFYSYTRARTKSVLFLEDKIFSKKKTHRFKGQRANSDESKIIAINCISLRLT